MARRLRSLQPVGMLLGGTYQIERQLAEGGMGVVYEASHVRLPLRFAVKVLHRPPEDEDSKIALERFEREAQVTATLQSPHVVRIYDYQIAEGGFPYIVMELLHGEDLARRIKKVRAPFEPIVAIELLEQISEALDAAHALSIVHRDLKPANVFLNHEPSADFVKVLDFGISKMKGDESITSATSIVGTPLYMSPEQAKGGQEITRAADIFSLGVIAYELLTGVRAFGGDSVPAILYNVLHAQPEPASHKLAPSVRAVDEVIAQAIAKEPAARFGTAAELVGSLRSALRPVLPSNRLRSDQHTVPLEQLDPLEAEKSAPAEPLTTVTPPQAPPLAPLPEVATRISASNPSVVVGMSTPVSTARPRASNAQIFAAAIVVFLCGVVGTVAGRRMRTRGAVPVAAPATMPPVAPLVHLVLRTVPVDSTVKLDDQLTSSRDLQLPSRATPRRLTVSHEGYQAEVRIVDADVDRDLTVALLPIVADSSLEPPRGVQPVRPHKALRAKPVRASAEKPQPAVQEQPVTPPKRPKQAPVQEL